MKCPFCKEPCGNEYCPYNEEEEVIRVYWEGNLVCTTRTIEMIKLTILPLKVD